MKPLQTFFATCAPGMEAILHQELRQLRMARIERQVGGVRFSGNLADAGRANLELATAVRVLWRRKQFQAPDRDQLYQQVLATDWSPFLLPEGSLRVDALCRESALDHSRFVEQVVKDAVVDQFRQRTGSRPSVDREKPDLRIHLHLFRDRATLSVDTSGASLHKRAWRRFQGSAPLAETLAAGLLRMSQWDRRAPLLDPFCGSGTLLIEGALWAQGSAPGIFRPAFAMEGWPGFPTEFMAKLRKQARERVRPAAKLRILGWDANPAQLEGARQNLEAAGLADRVELATGQAEDFAPRRGWNAWVVSNLPYGQRVGEESELLPLMKAFGERLRQHCQGYHLALLCGSKRLQKALALPRPKQAALKNGALDCTLLTTRMPEN
ncbi:MAG: RNA methyltransferase [Planctomycetota bacterium]|nr:MAG: RNA methyltransferase [Planctomycetota bacterium]